MNAQHLLCAAKRFSVVSQFKSKVAVASSLLTLYKTWLIVILAAATSSLSGQLLADDIEIYRASKIKESREETNPNVLVIADNSGSMFAYLPTEVTGFGSSYDPSIDYGTSDTSRIYVYTNLTTFSGKTVSKSLNACAALTNQLTKFPDNPVYADKFFQWRAIAGANPNNKNWRLSLETDDTPGAIVECRADQGVHGLTDDSDLVYASLCSSNSCNDAMYDKESNASWIHQPQRVYMVSANFHDYLSNNTITGTNRVYSLQETYYRQVRAPGGHVYYRVLTNLNKSNFCYSGPHSVKKATAETTSGQLTYLIVPQAFYFIDTINEPNVIYQCRQKIQVARQAMVDIFNTLDSINVGLMVFNENSNSTGQFSFDSPEFGGTVIAAVKNINGDSNIKDANGAMLSQRNFLVKKAQAIEPTIPGTPLTSALYEAYLYFSGQNSFFNDILSDDDFAYVTQPSTEGAAYRSPISTSCQTNAIVYMTDGYPSRDTDGVLAAQTLMGVDSCEGDSCLDEFASYIYQTGFTNPANSNKSLNASTYTIGFDIDLPLLQDTAELSGGKYFLANNYAQLLESFKTIFKKIAIQAPVTQIAPSVTVNEFNKLQHRSDLYYATFRPDASIRWDGNIKKYTINSDGDVLDNRSPAQNAVDSTMEFFDDQAVSYWSDTVDGSRVLLGGVREQLGTSRNFFVDGSVMEVPTQNIVKLSNSSKLSAEKLQTNSSEETVALNKWLLGVDIDDQNKNQIKNDAHQYIAESLHSKAFVLTYSGLNEDTADDILFFSTNLGTLHAVDASNSSGKELWSYMPEEFIQNVKKYRDNEQSSTHVYGLDSEPTLWVERPTSQSTSNFVDKAYLYQGMRRGGNTYFGWDITNANNRNSNSIPLSTIWKIKGGTGSFQQLGQTWSKPIKSKLSYNCTSASLNENCTVKEVLIFSGGYDTYYDNPNNQPNRTTMTNTVLGNAVYIVDALTGALLWSAGPDGSYSLKLPMFNSIPADPSPVDIDGDGDLDILFVVDISGAVFRIDFNQIEKSINSKYSSGGQIADLYENANFRRFYNGIDVSVNQPKAGTKALTLSVGSGYRAHPLFDEPFENRLYVMFDLFIVAPQIDNKGTTELTDDVADYRYVKSSTGSQSIIQTKDLFATTDDNKYTHGKDGNHGFYVNLQGSVNEQILQSSITFEGDILVASYVPAGELEQRDCDVGQIGSGRLYKISAISGSTQFFKETQNGSEPEPFRELVAKGIPTEPSVLIIEEEVITCYGADCDNETLKVPHRIKRTYWREK